MEKIGVLTRHSFLILDSDIWIKWGPQTPKHFEFLPLQSPLFLFLDGFLAPKLFDVLPLESPLDFVIIAFFKNSCILQLEAIEIL